jgi:hypothetical protein
MVRRTYSFFAFFFCMAALCGSCGALLAQTGNTLTVRMLDGKTGKLIAATGFLVRVDHETADHADWVVINENGTGKLTLPGGASLLLILGTYDSSMETFVNCDSLGRKNPVEHWYPVTDILTTGVVAPNGCERPSAAAKLMPHPKPGEFVFFVRKQNWRETMRVDY